jgi:hypothetical protein
MSASHQKQPNVGEPSKSAHYNTSKHWCKKAHQIKVGLEIRGNDLQQNACI